MKRLVLVSTLMLVAVTAALGAEDAPKSTVITLQPLVDALAPIIAAAAGAALTGILGVLFNLINKYTGITIDQNSREALHSAASTAAAALWAKLDVSLASKISIDVKSELLADGYAYVVKSVPDALKRFGADEETIKNLILSKFGALQVAATAQASTDTAIAAA